MPEGTAGAEAVEATPCRGTQPTPGPAAAAAVSGPEPADLACEPRTLTLRPFRSRIVSVRRRSSFAWRDSTAPRGSARQHGVRSAANGPLRLKRAPSTSSPPWRWTGARGPYTRPGELSCKSRRRRGERAMLPRPCDRPSGECLQPPVRRRIPAVDRGGRWDKPRPRPTVTLPVRARGRSPRRSAWAEFFGCRPSASSDPWWAQGRSGLWRG